MEVAGIGGMTLSLVTLPGLLASGIGALVFVGLDDWTGLGTFSLALPVPPAVAPTLATLAWRWSWGQQAHFSVVDPLPCTLAPSDRPPEPSVGHDRVRSADRA